MGLPLVPINSLQRHIAPLREALASAAATVIDSGHYVLGPGVDAFERAFAAYCGVQRCIGVGNGTDALELALRALAVGPGARVVVCANAAMYGTTAVIAAGAEPLFVDVRPGDGTMAPEALEAALAAHPDVAAVIVTHLYGQLADMAAIVPLCRARGIALVEDCAQAHGARGADGRCAGAYGDIACFSFYPTKNLGALGDGGALVTNDAGLADRARRLRQYGWSAKYCNSDGGGRNTRLDELQARFLLEMLPHLDDWNARRRHVANRYADGIRHPAIQVPPRAGADNVAHLYVVRCDRRDALREHLAAHAIQSDVHYPMPDHRQPCHGGRYDAVRLPVSEAEAARVLTLPCFPELDDAEVQRVIDACNSF
jgi:dTDP-4-amino-4,6-dideoxygalactose transaminase